MGGGGHCFTLKENMEATVVGVICRGSASPFIFSLFCLSVLSRYLVLLTCKDIQVSPVQVFLLDQSKKLEQKTVHGVTCSWHILCEKQQADTKREGPFIKSGVKFQCVIFPRSL